MIYVLKMHWICNRQTISIYNLCMQLEMLPKWMGDWVCNFGLIYETIHAYLLTWYLAFWWTMNLHSLEVEIISFISSCWVLPRQNMLINASLYIWGPYLPMSSLIPQPKNRKQLLHMEQLCQLSPDLYSFRFSLIN